MLLQDALANFLRKKATKFNADLIDRFLAKRLECQINCRTDIGTLLDLDKPHGWREHDGFSFGSIRYPQNAATTPAWNEGDFLGFPFDDYAIAIGSTGYGEHGSEYVGFDFDTILGHAPGVGVSDEQIEQIKTTLATVNYAELRRSTGGKGLHIYVLLSGFSDVANHTEHGALGRGILAKLSHDAGLDLAASVDACGGNMWLWSARATEENRGFELLKPATVKLTPADVPDWRAHVDVVSRKRSKVRVEGLDEEFAASRQQVKRDAQHDEIFEEYQKQGGTIIYQPDHACYLVHTAVLDKVHKALGLRGAFETTSTGNDPGKPNACAFLLPNGALLVVRFNMPKESPLWEKTKSGSPCIRYNVPLDPQAVCRAVEGVSTGKSFACSTVEQAKRAAKYFGVELPEIADRQITLALDRTGLLITCERKGKETPIGWAAERGRLKCHFNVDTPPDDTNHDELARHLQTPKHDDAGWALRRDNNTWGIEKKDTCRDALMSTGLKSRDAIEALGRVARNPYTIINEPFAAEFLSGRRWNRHGRRLIVPGTPGNHDHFDRIFAHCGKLLDDAVANDLWCNEHRVITGKHYLLLWAASLVQRPKQPLPYLFLWSKPNNTGKSALHRCLGMLIEDGATDVHSSLIESFNRPMAGSVLCFVEEASLPQAAYAKLKNWIDSPTITIREMHTNAYPLPNYAHFIQTANKREACPLEDGDERIVVIPVEPLDTKIPWSTKMAPSLQREAASFLATLLYETPLPPAADRLFLPVLTTSDKLKMMGWPVEKPEEKPVGKLVDAVAKLIEEIELFDGHYGDLLKAVGDGPWSASPATLSNYLKSAVAALRDRKINVAISPTLYEGQRRITIGPSWLVDTDAA